LAPRGAVIHLRDAIFLSRFTTPPNKLTFIYVLYIHLNRLCAENSQLWVQAPQGVQLPVGVSNNDAVTGGNGGAAVVTLPVAVRRPADGFDVRLRLQCRSLPPLAVHATAPDVTVAIYTRDDKGNANNSDESWRFAAITETVLDSSDAAFARYVVHALFVIFVLFCRR
jgi:hypothetical protein